MKTTTWSEALALDQLLLTVARFRLAIFPCIFEIALSKIVLIPARENVNVFVLDDHEYRLT